MRVIASLDRVIEDSDGSAMVVLQVRDLRHVRLCKEMDAGKLLSVEITPVKGKRSLEQNRYMWALLHEIDEVVNGVGSNGEWDLYCVCLEKAGAKFEYLMCRREAEDFLRHYFRAVRYAMPAEDDGMAWYKCYYGSSKMSKKEMGVLIDCVLDMAAKAGIETGYWRSVLK